MCDFVNNGLVNADFLQGDSREEVVYIWMLSSDDYRELFERERFEHLCCAISYNLAVEINEKLMRRLWAMAYRYLALQSELEHLRSIVERLNGPREETLT